jgi:hypothetical protein
MVIQPMVRDLEHLSDMRVPPPVIAPVLSQALSSSGDTRFDELVGEAVEKFRDRNPIIRREALERLWDAWERLKTILDSDKQKGIAALLARAAPNVDFRAILDSEGRTLTAIGNEFQIRHFETNKKPISSDTQVDYLFHRLFALVWLLLQSVRRDAA